MIAMVIGDMPPLPGVLGPRGPFCIPLRTSRRPMSPSMVGWGTRDAALPRNPASSAIGLGSKLRRRQGSLDLWRDRGRVLQKEAAMGILWIVLVGFVAGLIARFLSPGPNSPSGFLLTTVLGIAGAFLATFIGQAVGWYRLDQGASFV